MPTMAITQRPWDSRKTNQAVGNSELIQVPELQPNRSRPNPVQVPFSKRKLKRLKPQGELQEVANQQTAQCWSAAKSKRMSSSDLLKDSGTVVLLDR